MNKLPFFAMLLAGSLQATADTASATGWADDTIAVDATAFRIAVGEAALGYNADWCTGGTNVPGATVVLKAVANPDTANAATTTVSFAEGASLAAGTAAYEGDGYVRFILSAMLDGVAVGDSLVSDVSFGSSSTFTDSAPFDGRTNSLQHVIDARASASLRYDLQWANVASNAEISLVCVRRKKNGDILDVKTNSVESVDSPVMGNVDFATRNLSWGEYRLLLQEYASDGSLLLEMLSPEFYIPHIFGTCITIR